MVTNHLKEQFVNSTIFAQLGMERSRENATLADQCGRSFAGGENLDIRTETAETWCTDIDRFQWPTCQSSLFKSDRRVVLSSVGVALHRSVEHVEASLWRIGDIVREQDATGTGSEGRFLMYELIQSIVEAGAFKMFQERRRFAAGNYDGIQAIQVFRLTDEACERAKLSKTLCVDVEGSLECQDTDGRGGISHGSILRARSGLHG